MFMLEIILVATWGLVVFLPGTVGAIIADIHKAYNKEMEDDDVY